MGTRKNFVVPGGVTFDTSTLVVDDPNNRVGIKKTEPEYELDVAGVVKASNGIVTLTTAGAPSVALPDGAIAVDTTNGAFYFRSGGAWTQVTGGGGGGASITVSTTAPSSPSEGDGWFNSESGALFIYYDSVWVDVSGPAGPAGTNGTNGITLGAILTQSGTSYTLQKSDVGDMVSFTNSSAVTVEVPTEVSAGWVAGEGVVILQNGTGQVTVQGVSGVTINAAALAKTRTQFSVLSLVYMGSNVWTLAGDMSVL